ncbi:MAG: hypothetical protein ACE37K_21615 [Planctomycetota bacterium]
MHRPLVLVVALLALLLGLWLAFGDPTPAPVPDSGPRPSQQPAAPAGAEGERDDAPLGRTEVEATARQPEHADTSRLTLLGRCVDAGTAPLAGVAVQLRREATRAERDAAWDGAPAAALTAEDGRFRCEIGYDDWVDTVALRVHADGYCARSARWPQPQPGQTIDLGDIAMLRAIPVKGIVVDQQGVGVENVSMMFVYIALDGGQTTETRSMLRATSDAAGRFAFPRAAHPGEWYIGAEDTGALVAPRSVKLSDETSYDLRVVVERPDPQFDIRGTVRDTAGNPIAGLRLSVQGEGFIGRGRSGPSGAFTIRRAGPIPDNGKAGAALSVSDPEARYDRVQPAVGERVAWGARDVAVVMQQRGAQAVQVVDEAGAPVEDYTLFVLRGERKLTPVGGRTLRGHHPDGRARIERLPAGPHAVLAMPRRGDLAISAPTPFAVQSGVETSQLQVRTPPPVPTTVQVRTADGRPVAGSQVELLLALQGEAPKPSSPAIDLRDLDRYRRQTPCVVLARAPTADDGTASLRAPHGRCYVRVTGLAHTPHVQALDVVAPRAHANVTVQSAAVVRGRLTPPAAFARLQELARGGKLPVAVLAAREGSDPPPPAVADDEGRFVIGGLSPGSYTLSLRYWLRTGEVREGEVKLKTGQVTLADGETRTVELDVSQLLPGRVRGRIVAGGKPLADVHCFLRRTGPGSFLMLRIATDHDGRFEGLVPAGDYGFAMTYPAQPGPGWLNIVLPDSWTLAPGGEREVALDVPLRRARLRVVRDDRAVAGARIRILRTGYHMPGGLTTDAEGRVDVFPAPLEPFDVEVTFDGDKQRVGPFDLPLGATEGDVLVQLPG